MSDKSEATVSVEGKAVIRIKPSDFILIGSVTGEGTTLQNALDELEKKRAQVEPWLLEIGNATIEFGSARLPEQAEVDVFKAAAARGMSHLQSPTEPVAKTRKVFQAYSAVWSIEEMTSNQILIFSDRLRFETQDKPVEESLPEPDFESEEFDPEMFQKQLLARMEPNREENREAHFLFRSRLPKEEFESGIKNACENARRNAELIASGAGRKLGDLQSISGHSICGYDHLHNDVHRSSLLPMLNEVDLTAGERVSLSENPKPAKFDISLHASYKLI